MQINGGQYWDKGQLKKFKLWWVIAFACHVDYFFKILTGRGSTSFPTTRTVITATAFGLGPSDQHITIAMCDDARPEILLWAANFTVAQARQTASNINLMADHFEQLGIKGE